MVDLEKKKNNVRVCPSEIFFCQCCWSVYHQSLFKFAFFVSCRYSFLPYCPDLKVNYSAQYRVEAALSTVANDVIQL